MQDNNVNDDDDDDDDDSANLKAHFFHSLHLTVLRSMGLRVQEWEKRSKITIVAITITIFIIGILYIHMKALLTT